MKLGGHAGKKYHLKYIKNLKLPESQQNFKLGKSVHAITNYYLKGFKTDHLEQSLNEEEKTHWEAIKNNKILESKMLVTEWGFSSRVSDTAFWLQTVRIVDAVFFDP